MKSVVFTVTNDLSYDQRMQRICNSLSMHDYKVTLIGRKKKSSVSLTERSYRQVRLSCVFQKGKLFYMEYNARLLLYLLTHRFDVYCAIDLDSILPVCLISKWRKKKFIYDAHEFFTEMEEVVNRPLIQNVWKKIERWTIPKTDMRYTVSEGYAKLFERRYGKRFEVIRNVSVLRPLPEAVNQEPFIIYQGVVNVGRGLEALIPAMKKVDCPLKICGKGDVFDDLKKLTKKLHLSSRVDFCGYIEPHRLFRMTSSATIGVTLFTRAGMSNRFSLANRFFDYIHAGIPQIAMNYPEYKSFNRKYEVALLIEEVDEDMIATAINRLLQDKRLYEHMRSNCMQARERYNWQSEEKKLIGIYQMC